MHRQTVFKVDCNNVQIFDIEDDLMYQKKDVTGEWPFISKVRKKFGK